MAMLLKSVLKETDFKGHPAKEHPASVEKDVLQINFGKIQKSHLVNFLAYYKSHIFVSCICLYD
jgi:hypothetical protein